MITNTQRRPRIGVFDSGVGGLTVLSACLRLTPEYDYIFLGDNARAPYGDRPEEELDRFADEIVVRLLKEDVDAILIACNTISSISWKRLSEALDIPVIGTIRDTVAEIARKAPKSVGLIGTSATIHAGRFERELKEAAPGLEVFGIACPLFTPLIEAGKSESAEMEDAVRKTLAPWHDNPPEVIIYACTHYPLIESALKGYFGEKQLFLNPADQMAAHLYRAIGESPIAGNGSVKLLSSGNPEAFAKIADKVLPFAVSAEDVFPAFSTR